MEYIKLKEVEMFTLKDIKGYKFKKFKKGENGAKGNWLVSDEWISGYQKRWALDTDKGLLEVTDSQLGQMLASAFAQKSRTGSELLNGKFKVKTNGKEGEEIRYYINFQGYNDKPQSSPEEGEW